MIGKPLMLEREIDVICEHARIFPTGNVLIKGVGSKLVRQLVSESASELVRHSVRFQFNAVQGSPVKFEIS
jgi:hypothetical protein